ncbi:MAG: type IV pilus secretin PilQ [Acidiferrobacterales bacterium]
MKRTITNLQGARGARYFNLVRLLFIAVSLGLAGAAAAAEISAISWVSGSSSPVLQVQVQGKSSYKVSSHENGQRLRVSFADTALGSTVSDLNGRGPVKGVYPYLAHNGSAVHVDLLMTEPGQLKVVPTKFGYWIMASANARPSASGPAPSPAAAAAPGPVAAGSSTAKNVIKEVDYLKLPGDRMQIRLLMAQPPAQPAAFAIDNPPSISFDFANTRLALAQDTVQVHEGAVSDVIAIQAMHRSRIVLSLLTAARYTTAVSGNYFIITLTNPSNAAPAGTAVVSHFAAAVGTSRHSIANIDFRRGPQGDGRVIVRLSDSGVGINLRHEPGQITVDFLNSSLRPSLQRQLDVTDFATPVRYIDTFQRGRDVRMVIRSAGKYDHIAYQTDDKFTVDITPISAKSAKAEEHRIYTGKRLSLNFQNIDVRAALQVLADFTGLNFVASNDVKGSLTLRLNNVPWDQALAVILNAKGLAMERSGNIITVEPEAEMASQQKVTLEAAEQKQKLEPLTTALIPINYANAEDIAKLLKSIKAVNPAGQQGVPITGSVSYQKLQTESNTLLSPRGQVSVDKRTNSLLIQDIPAKIREVRKLIAKLDRPVRQVMIETRIVEATDNFARNLGVRLGIQKKDNTTAVCGTIDCNTTLLTPGSPLNLTGNALSVNLAAAGINTVSPGSLALTFMGLPSGNLLSLELSALQQEGKGKIISSPRIITANEKKAVIEQGQERTFLAQGGGLGTQSFLTKNAVLRLAVTPQITPDNRVILNVHITNDSFNSASPSDSTMNKKRITTQVLLDNGETVVIGGIYEQTKQTTVSKVPFLGDLPLIGWAFRTTDVQNNRDELLVFLTPRILSNRLAMR